jgi:hypothetical protein
MTEEQERIRGYLVAQGAKLTPAAIVDKIEAATAELAAAAMSVPVARWGERPQPEEWSGNEVMAHVLAAHAYFGGGILAVLDDAPLPPRPERQGGEGAPLRTAGEWLALLAKERRALFQRVLSADPDARLERTIEHPFFGPLNWRATLLFTRLHDLDHAGQLAKNAAALK